MYDKLGVRIRRLELAVFIARSRRWKLFSKLGGCVFIIDWEIIFRCHIIERIDGVLLVIGRIVSGRAFGRLLLSKQFLLPIQKRFEADLNFRGREAHQTTEIEKLAEARKTIHPQSSGDIPRGRVIILVGQVDIQK